ncbi:YesL family protein [Bacillus salipaludis]|uniref:YesL family protein n=1 Tax=Bacillus salipaludis TaxID=2547811 RepID=A0ABW8RM39_9BACI
MEGFTRGFYSISEWVMRFMYVNILWILFTFLGLVVFGFFPATTAMFAVVRKWVVKEYDIPVFNTFWQTYKSEFFRSSIIGLVISAFGLLLYSNIHIIQAITVPLLKLLYIPNVILILIFVLTLLYIFPVLVHFDIGVKGVVKNALIIMTINPIHTFCMGTLTGFLFFIYRSFPGLIPFFSGSLIAFLLMWFSNNVFGEIR